MNKPIDQSEKQALFDKRRNLFALLQDSENTPNQLIAPAPPPPRQSVQTLPTPTPAQGQQAEEVQDMLRKFVNPNADRWSLF